MYCATVKFVFWSPRCKPRPSTAYCLITNNQVLFGSMAACYETAWSMALSTGRQTNVYIVCYIGIRVSFFFNFIEYRRFNHFQILYLVFQTISSIFFLIWKHMLERRAASINIMNHETRPEYLCVSSRPIGKLKT